MQSVKRNKVWLYGDVAVLVPNESQGFFSPSILATLDSTKSSYMVPVLYGLEQQWKHIHHNEHDNGCISRAKCILETLAVPVEGMAVVGVYKDDTVSLDGIKASLALDYHELSLGESIESVETFKGKVALNPHDETVTECKRVLLLQFVD